MSAMDKMAAAAENAGHRVDEAMTGGKNTGKETGMHAQENLADTGRQAQETATTASHMAHEKGQEAQHAGESIIDKAKHALGINK